MAGIKRDSADKWFSDCIRHAAGYQCEHCHKGFEGLVQGLEACHIYGRANKSTRWCVENCVSMCSGCHRSFTEHPIAFNDWLLAKFGEGRLDILREKKRAIFKTTKPIRLEIAKHYRQEFRKMVRENSTDLVSYN